jgi:hypothetical protein
MNSTDRVKTTTAREGPAKCKEVKREDMKFARLEAERLRSMARFGISMKQRREK